MQVRDSRAAVTGTLRWMWQQFPPEWEVTADQLVLHLWRPRGGELAFTREAFEEFCGPAKGADEEQEFGRLAARSVTVLALGVIR